MDEARALEELAQALALKVKQQAKGKPTLRLVKAPPPAIFDSVTRDGILRRIRFLAKAYGLQWLVDQDTFNHANVECLDDRAISTLLRRLEHARECIADGVSMEDAGLVRSFADDIPDHYETI